MVLDPDMMKDVMVKDFSNFTDRRNAGPSGNNITDNFLTTLDGQEWKRMRSVMTPTFTSGKMRAMFDIIESCCKPLKEKLTELAESNQDMDCKTVFGCYTMDVIAKCCFATETDAHKDPNNIFLFNAIKFFDVFGPWAMVKRFLIPFPIKKLIGYTPNPKESLDFFEGLTKALVDKRRREKIKSKDYLQLLLDAGDQDSNQTDSTNDTTPDNEAHHGHEDKAVSNSSLRDPEKRNLTDDEIVSNAVLFLAVGYETTGSLLSFASYALACNPEAQELLHQELKEAYESNNHAFDYNTVSSLKYLDAVISETLRAFPPATRMERKSATKYKFAKNGIVIEKGSHVHIPIYAIHHTEDFWPEHEKFDPSRFLAGKKEKIIPYTYVPFGAGECICIKSDLINDRITGPRNCIGMRFALLEAKLALANILLNFRFKKSPRTAVPLDFSNAQILLKPKEMIIGVESRN